MHPMPRAGGQGGGGRTLAREQEEPLVLAMVSGAEGTKLAQPACWQTAPPASLGDPTLVPPNKTPADDLGKGSFVAPRQCQFAWNGF